MSFSVPRCRRPICGSTRSTTSPSSSSTRRNTPCAAGCCGPKLMEKLRRFWSVTASSLLPLRLLIPRQRRAFPRAQEIEVAEFLIEPHRLVTDALLLIVVANLDETGHREVLAQRMAVEAVVGEKAPRVRMAIEQHAEEVVNLALVPVRARIDRRRARDRHILAGVDLDSDPPIQLRRQQ